MTRPRVGGVNLNHRMFDGDDLRQVRDVDIVISTTGRAGLLTAEHLHPRHRLVVDAGFVPHPDGPHGDVHPSAQHLPQAITPVPGGVGPIEMATLAERLTEDRVRRILDPLLTGAVPGALPEDDLRYVLDLGLLREISGGGNRSGQSDLL